MASQKSIRSWCLVEDRGVWSVRMRVYDEITQVTKTKTKSTGIKTDRGSKRRATQVAKEIVDAVELQFELETVSPNRSLLFKDYVTEWLNNKDVSTRENTAKSYRDYAEKHILPALGDYQVKDISWRLLQVFYDTLLKTHKVASVKKYNIVVSGALEDAIRDNAIQTNPAKLVKWPQKEKYTARPLTKIEAVRLLEIAENAGEPMRTAIMLGLCYGLRRSEVCGLRWIDIDFKNKTMHIRHTVTQNGGVLLDDEHTKTKRSNRVLSLVDNTIPHLKELRARQLASGRPLDKVVAWPNGKTMRPDGVTRMFKTLLRQNGINTSVRFHDLRHTAASLLAASGVPPKQLQAFLGHDDISVTLDIYVHLSETATEETSQKMSEIFGSEDKKSENYSGFCSGWAKTGAEMENIVISMA